MSSDERALRSAIGEVVTNAMNYPDRVSHHVLGEDLGPLISKITEAVQEKFLPEHDRLVKVQAWDEGLLVGQDPYGFDTTNNPYRRTEQ